MAHCCLNMPSSQGKQKKAKRKPLQTKSLWRFYRFESSVIEQEYQEAYSAYTLEACRLWSFAQLIVFVVQALVITSWSTKCFIWVPLLGTFLTGGAMLVALHSGIFTSQSLRWLLNIGIATTMALLIWTSVAEYEARVAVLQLNFVNLDETLRNQVGEALRSASSLSKMFILLFFCEVQAQPLIYIGFYPSTVVAFLIGPTCLLALSIFFFAPTYIPVVCAFTFAMLHIRQTTVICRLRRSLFKHKQHRIAQAEASKKTDGIINHILKNTMAEAKGLLEMFCDVCVPALPSGLAQKHIHTAITSLQAGLGWCQRRKVLTAILAGEYQVQSQEIPLEDLINNLTLHRDVKVTHPGGSVKVDASVCDLILENALSNAFRHGNPIDPGVSLTVSYSKKADEKESLTFLVSNRIHPTRRFVSSELAASVLGGPDLQTKRDELSDGEGLRHCCLAAQVLGIDTPKLWQQGDLVFFQVTVPAASTNEPVTPSTGNPEAGVPCLPPGLHILILDDSASARKLLQHQLTKAVPQVQIQVFGESAAELVPCVQSALDGADIVILDQHLDWPSGDRHLGTDVAVDLLSRGFQGFLCIRTANTCQEDVSKYWGSGVHCVLDKGLDRASAIATLSQSFHSFVEGKPELQDVGSIKASEDGSQYALAASSALPGSVPADLCLQRNV